MKTMLRRLCTATALFLGLFAAGIVHATPSVSFVTPTSGSTIALAATPAGVPITVNASPTSSYAIASVQFFVDGTLIGTAAGASPFTVPWFPTSSGAHTITVTVTDTSTITTGASASTNTTTINSFVTVTTVRTVTLATSSGTASVAQDSEIFLRSTAAMSDAIVAKVEFFVDGVLIPGATVTQAPYNAAVVVSAANGFTAGTHNLVAKATASDGTTTTNSPTVPIAIGASVAGNQPPTVAITSPTGGTLVTVNSSVTLTANASDADGFIPSAAGGGVMFFVDGDPVTPASGETNPDLLAPYSITWKPAAAKAYSLRAQTIDDKNNIVLSAPVIVTAVGSLPTPTVSLTAPTAGATVATGATVALTATVAASGGATISKVEFFAGATLIGTALASPYTVNWVPTSTGSVSLTAKVTDSNGVAVTSSAVSVTVATAVPTVAISSPTNGAVIPLGTTTTLSATASSTGGTAITRVDFLSGTTVVGTALVPASGSTYSISWQPTAAGIQALTAKATDANGTTSTSPIVNLNVTAPSVALTNPTTGSTVTLGAPVSLTASASAVAPATLAKVEFLAGTNVIGTATSAPFTSSWTPSATGTFSLTARVTDSNGGVATSSAVSVVVATSAPSIALTNPTNGAVFGVASTVTLAASPTASSGAAVSRVDFLAGTTTIGTALSAPYTISWTPSAVGVVSLTAKVTDSSGAVATSPAVNVSITGPSVALTSPVGGSSLTSGASVAVSANASATAPTSVAKVEFFAGTTLIGTATSDPYSISWTPSATGTFSLTARVTDSNGGIATSSAVSVVVATSAPTVSLTAPANGTAVGLGASVVLLAAPTASSGATVGRVDFLVGTTLVGTALSAPYSATWAPSSAGVAALTAKVTDSSGATATSAIVNINVTAPSVAITSPTAGTIVANASTMTLTAAALAIAPATVTRVDYYAGSSFIDSATSAPFSVNWTPTSNGTVSLTAKVTDSNGAVVSSSPVAVTVSSSTAPTVTFTSPAPGALVTVGTGVTLLANATASAGATVAQVQFTQGSTILATLTAPPYMATWTPATAGNATLTARVIDSTNANATTSVSVTAVTTPVDPTLPSVQVSLSPSTATTLPKGAVRNIFATVTPGPGRAIERVQFFVDGQIKTELFAPPYTYRFTATADTGTATVTVHAIDNGGATRDIDTTFTMLAAVGASPTVALLAPAPNTTVTPGTAVNFAAIAQDDSAISNVQFYARGEPQGAADTSSPYTGSFTPPTAGNYVLDAIATDDKGNTGVSAPVTLTVAFATPTVVITSPNPGATARATPNVPLTLTTTAQGGGGAAVLLVEFLVDGVAVGTRTSPTTSGGSTYSFQWTPTTAQLGAHVVTARVTDVNSQTATSAALNVNVATVVGTPPSVSITSPTGSAATSIQSLSMVNFVASAFASGSGNAITSVEFFLNDTSIGVAAKEQSTNLYRLVYNVANLDLSPFTPDANGRYSIPLYAIAKDSSGNQTISATTNLGVTPSTSAPPSVQLASLGGSSVAQGTAFFMGTTLSDSDGTVTSLQLFANGAASGSAIANPGTATVVTFTPTTAGRFNLYVVATDDTGNTAISTPPVVLTVTAVSAPSTAITRPTDDSTITTTGAPVFLEATASGADATQIPTVTFIATGTSGARTTVNATRVGTTSTYRATWSPSVADTYSVVSQATLSGVSGNSTSSRRVVVTNVVGISPTVTLNTPGNNASVTTASTVNFTATAADSDGSVVGVEFFVNRNSIGAAVRDQLTNTWRLPSSVAGLLPGAYEVVALARDSAGNVAASATNTLNITAATGQAPSLTINASATTVPFSQQVRFTASAIDADGSISTVQYFANGSSIGSTGNSGTSFQVTWTPNASGTFNVYAVATDSNGNTAVSPTLPITVKRNNPVLDDDAFILQSYIDIANNTSPNLFLVQNYSAQLAADTLTRAQLVNTLTAETGFSAPVNLLASYYILMGQWPTPANYNSLLGTARSSLANAIGSVLSSPEYIAKYPEHVTPTVALLNNPASAIPATTFATRLWANAGRGAPSPLEDKQFRDNDTVTLTLGRGYNVAGLNTAIAEFVTLTNATNNALMTRVRAAALYYQLDKPPTSTSTDEIAARITALAKLTDLTAVADAVLKDTLYTYRFVTIVKHPQSLVVAPRSGALFSVEAIGLPPLTYQWLFNGVPIAGANGPLLSITNADATKTGTYTVAVTTTAGTSTSDPATLTLSTTPTKLANISTRGVTGGGNQVLIAGFVVTGTSTQTRQMLIRVVGPTLASAGVAGALSDPRLEVYNVAGSKVLENDDWRTQAAGNAGQNAIQQAASRVGAFALPANSADAAVLATLAPGSYTVQAKGSTGNASGIVLIEVYDASSTTAGPKAINVSTRGEVGTGGNVLIAGFVVNGAVSRRVLIRGVGPTLRNFGLPANTVLADPQLTLTSLDSGQILKLNDDWSSSAMEADIISAAAKASGAFPLADGSKDAAMIVMLAPGAYTVQLSGTGTTNNTGIGIVEVYDVDP